MQEPEQIQFSVSDSFSLAGEIFQENLFLFFVIFFVCGLPEMVISGVIGDSGGAVVVNFLVALIGYAIAEPAVTWATLIKLEDPRASLKGTMEHGFDFFGPVVVVNLIATIAVMIGLLALIVPGLIIYSLVFFVVPAIVDEKCGVIESLERSVALGRGIRGEVFLLMFIYFVLLMLIGVLPDMVLSKLPYVGAFILLILASGISAFGTVLAAVAFRQIKMNRGMTMGVVQT